jgi:hypothetical protein
MWAMAVAVADGVIVTEVLTSGPMDHHAIANLANAAGKAFVSKRDACRMALNWVGGRQ